MSKKRRYAPKSFESLGHDTSANIYSTMLVSKAWIHLSPSQKALYLTCKSQYFAEKKKPLDNELYFTMNRSKWLKMYHLYSDSNQRGFYRDMKALIEHGFIKCIESGKATRTKSIYAFSDKWRLFGSADFEITADEMNSSMILAIGKMQQQNKPSY